MNLLPTANRAPATRLARVATSRSPGTLSSLPDPPRPELKSLRRRLLSVRPRLARFSFGGWVLPPGTSRSLRVYLEGGAAYHGHEHVVEHLIDSDWARIVWTMRGDAVSAGRERVDRRQSRSPTCHTGARSTPKQSWIRRSRIRNLLPRDVPTTLPGCAGKLLDRLANHFELADDGILAPPLRPESVAADRGVLFDVVESALM